MRTIDSNLLKELTSIQGEPCISLYMTTHPIHPERAKDPITFKNLYKKTLTYIQEQQLKAHESLLTPLEKLVDNKDFWEHNEKGLAIFVSSHGTEIFRLPEEVQEISCVADSFCVKPLFKLYNENQQYYLLALGLDSVKLYQGDKYQLEEVNIEGEVPTSMKEALGHELTDNHLHASVVQGAGLHGYMEKSQEEDIDMERFFREVDRAILDKIDFGPHTPLLLAALPEHHTAFLRISKNPYLSPKNIQTNPGSLRVDGLLEKVQEILNNTLQVRKEELLERYQLAKPENLSSSRLGDVVRDAIDGKIEVLCVEDGKSIRGSVDLEKRKFKQNGESQTDIIDALARMVFNTGGNVVVLDKQEMPLEEGVFTINRY